MSARPLAICIIYDRVYPASIGGAERWYRTLAERLAADGHQVTYLTSRHWQAQDTPSMPGARIVTCTREGEIYGRGRRRIRPVLRFGLGVARHLARHGQQYDAVHSSAMLSWAALSCVAFSKLGGYRVILDWWEVWPFSYWRRYLGRAAGTIGWFLQRILALSPHSPVAHSDLSARRIARLRRGRAGVPVMRGLLPSPPPATMPTPADPLVVFLGRHIPEKQVPAIVRAVAVARKRCPTLRAVIFGDGPDSANVRRTVAEVGLTSVVQLPGFGSEEQIQETLRRSLCLVLLSHREGFGLVVAEAAAVGVPSVVLRHEESAASELIAEGVNGFLCRSSDPEEVASVILRIHDAGFQLRSSTLAWCKSRGRELSIESSLPHLLAIYRGEAISGRSAG